MSDHEFENYLTLISRFLRLSPAQREAIGEELRDHFESRLAELVERGHSHAEAVRLALEEFGDAAGLAADFSSITQTRRRRLIMRCTVASVAALATAVIVAMAVWPENHAGRMVGNAVAETKEKKDDVKPVSEALTDDFTAQTEEKLTKYVPADYVEIPLSNVLADFGKTFGVQIYLDMNSLKEAAIDPTALPVSIHLPHVRGRMLLELILRQFNLGFMVRDGILIVATKDILNNRLETKVYDCRNILAADNAEQAAAKSAIEGTSSQSASVDDPQFHSWPSAPSQPAKLLHFVQNAGPPVEKKHTTTGTPAGRLIDIITDTIAPQSWSVVGGPGTIMEYNGLLVISQTAEVHAQIADLLDQISAKLAAKKK